jgi:amidase
VWAPTLQVSRRVCMAMIFTNTSSNCILGSIRIPSLCCGTYGFKPSSNRVAYGRQVMPLNWGISAIAPSAGPLANDIDSLRIFMKAVIDARPFLHDSTVLDVPWREIDFSSRSKLRLGLLGEDLLFPLHPPVKETIDRVVKSLILQGHEIVVLETGECEIPTANIVAGKLLGMDSTPIKLIMSGGEPPVPSMGMFAQQMKSIDWNITLDLNDMDPLQQFGTLQNKRAEITNTWRKLWAKHNLDAIISPAAQNTAVEHDGYGWPAYSTFLNVLDVSILKRCKLMC